MTKTETNNKLMDYSAGVFPIRENSGLLLCVLKIMYNN